MGNIIKVDFSRRPGCATSYALYTWFYSILVLLLGLALLFLLITSSDASPAQLLALGAFSLLCLSAFVAVPVLLGIGIWRMRRWAYGLGITLHGLIALLFLAGLVLVWATGGSSEFAELAYAGFPLIALNLLLALWFYTNRHLFRTTGRTVAPIASDLSTRVNVLFTGTFLSIPLLLAVCACMMIVVTTLFGSQIGEFFSAIVDQLSTQP